MVLRFQARNTDSTWLDTLSGKELEASTTVNFWTDASFGYIGKPIIFVETKRNPRLVRGYGIAVAWKPDLDPEVAWDIIDECGSPTKAHFITQVGRKGALILNRVKILPVSESSTEAEFFEANGLEPYCTSPGIRKNYHKDPPWDLLGGPP